MHRRSILLFIRHSCSVLFMRSCYASGVIFDSSPEGQPFGKRSYAHSHNCMRLSPIRRVTRSHGKYRGNERRFEQQDRTAVDRNAKFDLNFRRIRLICALCSSYISLQAFIVAEWLARWTHDRMHRAQRSLIRLKFQLNLLFRWTVVRSCCSKRRTWPRCLSSDHDMSINWNFSRIRLLCALSGRLRSFL